MCWAPLIKTIVKYWTPPCLMAPLNHLPNVPKCNAIQQCAWSTVQKYSTTLNQWTVLPHLQHSIKRESPCFVKGPTIRIYNPDGEFLESYALENRP